MEDEATRENKIEAPDILEDMISESGIPEEDRPEVRKMIAMSLRMGAAASPQAEMMKKVTTEHISQMLSNQEADSQRHYSEKQAKKWFSLAWLVIICVFMTGVIWLLRGSPETLEKVLYAAGGLIAGGLGGYGYGRSSRTDDE